MEVMDGWETVKHPDHDYLRWVGTAEEFEQWRKNWKLLVPKCPDFTCVHELMSCGIARACGECSIFGTMRAGTDYICADVNCMDCNSRNECIKTDETKEHPKGV